MSRKISLPRLLLVERHRSRQLTDGRPLARAGRILHSLKAPPDLFNLSRVAGAAL